MWLQNPWALVVCCNHSKTARLIPASCDCRFPIGWWYHPNGNNILKRGTPKTCRVAARSLFFLENKREQVPLTSKHDKHGLRKKKTASPWFTQKKVPKHWAYTCTDTHHIPLIFDNFGMLTDMGYDYLNLVHTHHYSNIKSSSLHIYIYDWMVFNYIFI